MEEIKVGEYIRTTEGCIVKIKNDEHLDFLKFSNAVIGDIVKHSKDIIDLIEVGDYVNGYKVDDIENGKLIIGNTALVVEQITENEDIKTILTHEMYEQNCYKVGKD